MDSQEKRDLIKICKLWGKKKKKRNRKSDCLCTRTNKVKK